MLEIEVDEMPPTCNLVLELQVRAESFLGGNVVVENDDLVCSVGDLEKLVVVRCDVDEDDLCTLDVTWVDPVFVSAGHESTLLSPASPGSPGSTESIRTTRVVVADALHGQDPSSNLV